MSSAPIDFSSVGGVPAQPQGGINFSSIGGKPVADDPSAPTAQPQQPGLISRIGQGVKESALGTIWNTAIAPPQNATEAHIAMIAGPQALTAYRAAKGLVNTAENTMKATGDKYTQAVNDFARMAQDYQNKDYRNMVSDVASGMADVEDPAGRVRELSEGARPGGNLATPVTKDLIDTGLAAIGGEATEDTEAAEEAAAKPSLVQRVVKGEKVAQEPATQSLGKTAAKVTQSAGVEAPAGENAVNAFGEAGDNILAKAKSQYQALDDATGGRFQRFQERLDNIHDQLSELTGTEEDVAKESKLLKAQQETEDAMSEAFEDAKANGVDPATADQAKAAYKQGNALRDLDTQVFRSRVVESTDITGQSNRVNPSKLLPRLQQMYKSGRLQEAVGADNAIDLLKQTNDLVKTGTKAAKLQSRVAGAGKYLGRGALIGAGGTAIYELTK